MRVSQKQSAKTASLPAPVGGLNARDAWAAMSPKDAVVLDNWWCYPNYVGIRDGYSDWSTGYPTTVETLLPYAAKDGSSEIFAAAGTAIYDATTQGAVGAAVVTGQSNARWYSTNIGTPGGSFLYAFNGEDDPLLYDGSTWQAVNAASAPIAITGITTNLLVQANVFKNRLWMVEKNSMNVWYLAVQSVGGAATKFDLSTIFQLGGNLVAMATWTIDSGVGMDDYAVFITSEGELAVYRGTDPAAAATFYLVGVFRFGIPVGRRCFAKYGGDLMLLTAEGVYPLARGLLSSSINRAAAVTDKIQNAVSQAISSYGNNYGWTVLGYSNANMLIVNVPAGNGANYQFAQNTITSAWSIFKGWNASCFETLGADLYFGDATGVRKAWLGDLDGSAVITADVLTSFQYFGNMAQEKQWTMVRPYIQTNGNPSILYGLNVNFFAEEVTGTLTFTPPNPSMTWGSMVWGSMVWGGSMVNITAPHSVGEIGNSAALRMKVQGNGAEVQWSATDFTYQVGGFL